MKALSESRVRLGPEIHEGLRKGRVDEDDLRRLDAYRRSFAEAYEQVVATIREATQLDPTGRPAKSTTSIIEKLRRETLRLSQMQDIAGCRLVVKDVLAQNQIVERLKSALANAAVVDRREQPSYGYRAVHIIATARNKQIEIQVRTELQHLWAQLSEKLSDVVDATIKYGGGEPDVRARLAAISRLTGSLEDLELRPGSGERAQRVREIKRELRQYLEDAIATGRV